MKDKIYEKFLEYRKYVSDREAFMKAFEESVVKLQASAMIDSTEMLLCKDVDLLELDVIRKMGFEIADTVNKNKYLTNLEREGADGFLKLTKTCYIIKTGEQDE